MTPTAILADTGPLVALLDRSDSHHDWATECFRELRPPIFTCEAVLAEAWHLLSFSKVSRRALAGMCSDGIIEMKTCMGTSQDSIWKLLRKYEDTPMDYTDAYLVRLTELLSAVRVWTIDSDFKVYRRQGRLIIHTIAPWR